MSDLGTSHTEAILWPETDPASPLGRELAGLHGMDRHALRIAFRKVFRREAPEGLGRALLVRMIAHRRQAMAHGDLDAWEEALMTNLLPAARSDPAEAGAQDERAEWRSRVRRAAAEGRKRKGQHRPGTMVFREYAGEIHRVTIRRDGYEWKGERFASLSEIARRITGTNWNGPRFFGLREKDHQPSEKRP